SRPLPYLAPPRQPPRPTPTKPQNNDGGVKSSLRLTDRAVLLLLATTGILNGELRTIQLQDIDWRAGEVLVRRTKG
ncbi:integrase, partial [Mesorhizobium sp. M0520]